MLNFNEMALVIIITKSFEQMFHEQLFGKGTEKTILC